MTTEQIKEQLSYHYLASIFSRAGCKISKTELDHGVDFSIRKTGTYLLREKNLRHMQRGGIVDIQHKFATEKQIKRVRTPTGEEWVLFDLDIKNYNDLIYRRSFTALYDEPALYLLLVVFPDDESKWLQLEISPEKHDFRLTFNAVAYWFFPGGGDLLSERSSSKRITIQASNVVDFQFVGNIFKSFLL